MCFIVSLAAINECVCVVAFDGHLCPVGLCRCTSREGMGCVCVTQHGRQAVGKGEGHCTSKESSTFLESEFVEVLQWNLSLKLP